MVAIQGFTRYFSMAGSSLVLGLIGLIASIWGFIFLYDTYAVIGFDVEQGSVNILWAFALGSVALGFCYGRHARYLSLTIQEMLLPLLIAWSLLCLSFYGTGLLQTAISATLWRLLLLLPFLWLLCVYFGATLHVLKKPGIHQAFAFEPFIGQRYLQTTSSELLSTVTLISIVGTMLGVWLVLVAVGILTGFENDLRQKIIGVQADISLQKKNADVFDKSDISKFGDKSYLESVGVEAMTSYVMSEVALSSSLNYAVATVFGIDVPSVAPVVQMLEHLVQGELADLQEVSDKEVGNQASQKHASIAGIVVGAQMARSLGVEVGDKIRMLSPDLTTLTPLGPQPKSQTLYVAGIFVSGMYEFDARYAYMLQPALNQFLEQPIDAIGGLWLKCRHSSSAWQVARLLKPWYDGSSFYLETWSERNQTLFSALKLERLVAFVVLVFIILVASFSIVNTLTIAITEKRRAIAILKTIGAQDVHIVRIFLTQGLWVGGLGTVLGTMLGVFTLWSLKHFGFWIPDDVYYIDALPVALELKDITMVICATILMLWNFAVFPSIRGAQWLPVEGLRDR